MQQTDLIYYIDKLRFMKNLSQEDFTDSIISLRQYHRYLSGNSQFPYHLLEKFSDKLNINVDAMLSGYEEDKYLEQKLVSSFYNKIIQRDFIAANEIRNKLNPGHFINKSSNLLFQYSTFQYEYMTNEISSLNLLHKTISIINYPSILKNNLFSTYEFLILTSLLSHKDFNDKTVVYEKVIQVLDNKSIIIGSQNNHAYILSLYRLSRYAGFVEDYQSSIRYSQMIIDFNRLNDSIFLLDFAYLFLSSGYYFLKDFDLYNASLIKLYYVLKINDNDARFKSISKSVHGFFNIDFESYVVNLIKKANSN